MRVLLVSANRERSPYPVFPLGLAFLASALSLAGHKLSSLDLCFTEDPEAGVKDALELCRPDVAIISIRNIDNVTYPLSRSYLGGIRRIVELCRGR